MNGGEEEEEAAEEEEEDGAAKSGKKRKRTSVFSRPCLLSAELQEFLGCETMSRPEVVKAIWAYVKEHDLQNPKDKRKIVLDEKLGKVFKAPLNMLNMNKQLQRHIKSAHEVILDEDEEGQGEEEEEEAPKKKTKAAASRAGGQASTSRGAAAGGKKKKGGQTVLSAELQEFLGCETMSRPEVVKAIWAYIREHDLQDPSDRRNILPDDKLGKILKAPVGIFSMNKQLSKHFI